MIRLIRVAIACDLALILTLTLSAAPQIAWGELPEDQFGAPQVVEPQHPPENGIADFQEHAREQKQRLQALQELAHQANSNKPAVPTAEFEERVRRAVRSNFSGGDGNLTSLDAVVEVKCAPSGLVLSASIVASSGDTEWDEAALRAVQKTNPMPIDTNGTVPPKFKVTLRPSRQISIDERRSRDAQAEMLRTCKRTIAVVRDPEPHLKAICAPTDHP